MGFDIKTMKDCLFKDGSPSTQLPPRYCVKTYGVFVDESCHPIRVGFVMKKYTTNLWLYLQENAFLLTWDDKKKLIIQCLECLKCLHSSSEFFPNRILHNNIKAENFLLMTNNGIHVDELVVSDFGFTDLREYQDRVNSYCCCSGVYDKQKANLIYQAPENFINDDQVFYSKQSDIFSMGRIIGEILTCKKPFHSLKSRNAIFKACSLNNDPSFTPSIDCPPLLLVVKNWCCTSDINKRPSSCEQVLDLLGKCTFEQSLEQVEKEKHNLNY